MVAWKPAERLRGLALLGGLCFLGFLAPGDVRNLPLKRGASASWVEKSAKPLDLKSGAGSCQEGRALNRGIGSPSIPRFRFLLSNLWSTGTLKCIFMTVTRDIACGSAQSTILSRTEDSQGVVMQGTLSVLTS